MTAHEPVADLVATDRYRVQVSVPVDHLGRIDIPRRRGDRAAMATVFYRDGVEISGRVVKLLGDLETEGRMARLQIIVDDPLGLKDPDAARPPLLLGEFVRVAIQGRPLAKAFRISRAALRDNTAVWIATADNTLDIRTVQTVWRDKGNGSGGPGNRLRGAPGAFRSGRSGPGNGPGHRRQSRQPRTRAVRRRPRSRTMTLPPVSASGEKSQAPDPKGPGPTGPIAWMTGHSVSANLLMLVLLIGGLIMGARIKKEVFPDFDLDMVTVTVAYPGASPEEVEQGILLAVEEAIQGLEGIEEVTSVAREGAGTVTVEILEGEDALQITRDIESEVDRITSFPDDAEEPQVVLARRKRSVISLALFGDHGEHVLRDLAETVRDQLLQDPDITQVDLDGVRDYEISIEISRDTLRAYGLTLDGVAQILSRAAVELPGGAIKTASGDVLVRVRDRRDYGPEFGRIPVITAPDGTEVLLEEIATITDGFEETDRFATFNGHPSVMIEVYRIGDQTPISVSDAVRRQMAGIREQLPPGMGLEARNDRSEIYRQRLDLMLRNGYLGLGLVFVLLAIFLEARLAFWVSLGIPISFLGSLLFLPAMGVSINMISMFAFIVTLGIVVDDAIVVGENIYYYRQSGLGWFPAAVRGAREIAMPVIFSVLTNMVTFLPMLFVPGFMGKVFKQIPLVVVCVFALSLVESLLILPAHLGHQKVPRERGMLAWIGRNQQRFSLFFNHMVRTFYGPFLGTALRWRYVTLSAGVAVLLVTIGLVRSGRMGFELFPKVESDYAKVTAVLPYGSAVEKTLDVQRILVQMAQAAVAQNGGRQLSEGIYARIDANEAQVRIYLTPPDVRPISTAALTRIWRKKVGRLPGLESLKFESDAGGPGRGAALSVELSHRNIEVLDRASADLARSLATYPRTMDIDDGFSPGKQQIDFRMRPEGRSVGLRARDVARQVRYAYYGAEVLRQQRGRDEVRVVVRLPRDERVSEYDLEEMILRTPAGTEIPLREAVQIDRGRAYTTIDPSRRRRVAARRDRIPRPYRVPRPREPLHLPDRRRRAAGRAHRHCRGRRFPFRRRCRRGAGRAAGAALPRGTGRGPGKAGGGAQSGRGRQRDPYRHRSRDRLRHRARQRPDRRLDGAPYRPADGSRRATGGLGPGRRGGAGRAGGRSVVRPSSAQIARPRCLRRRAGGRPFPGRRGGDPGRVHRRRRGASPRSPARRAASLAGVRRRAAQSGADGDAARSAGRSGRAGGGRRLGRRRVGSPGLRLPGRARPCGVADQLAIDHRNSGADLRRRGLLARRFGFGGGKRRIEITADMAGEGVHMRAEEVVRALDQPIVDGDVLLAGQFLHQFLDRGDRNHLVGRSVQNQARGRAGRQEREVVQIRRDADRDEPGDFRAAHHQLHADPGAERVAADPARRGVWIVGLHPVQGRRRVAQFAEPVVEFGLRAADAAKIEPEGGKTTLDERLVHRIDDAIVHRSPVLRMRMQQQRNGGVRFPGVMITAFKAAVGPIQCDFRHFFSRNETNDRRPRNPTTWLGKSFQKEGTATC